jgi:CelD/BcsL family acetyltransferase involved in cellulose biosynthesis
MISGIPAFFSALTAAAPRESDRPVTGAGETAGPACGVAVDLVSSEKTFRDLRNEWNRLLDSSRTRSVFLTWEWLYYWWQYFRDARQLYLLVARDRKDGTLAGIAPLCLEQTRLLNAVTVNKVRFLGSEKVGSDFLDFISAPGREKEILEGFCDYLYRNRYRWDVLELGDMDDSSPSLPLLTGRLNRYFRALRTPAGICPYIRLPKTYDEFLRTLDGGMRNDLRKKTRHLKSLSVAFSINGAREGIRSSVEQLFRLHNDGFRIKKYAVNSKSSFAGSDIHRFHQDIAPAFMANDRLKLYFFGYRGKPVACLYTFAYKNRLFCYQSGFDRSWRQWSPGTVLTGYCIKDCIEQGFEEFHYLRGSEPYKSRWTRTALRTTTLTMVNPTFRGVMYGACIGSKDRLKKFMASSPFIQRFRTGGARPTPFKAAGILYEGKKHGISR